MRSSLARPCPDFHLLKKLTSPVRDFITGARAESGCLFPGIQTVEICLISVISGPETGRSVELIAFHRVLTRRTGRCGPQKNKIPLLVAAPPSARLRAARIAPATGAFREIGRDEIPRDRSFWNIFLDQVQAPQSGVKATGRDGHQSRPSLEHALCHFEAPPAPHASLCRKSTSVTKTGADRSRTALAPGPGKSAPRVSATDPRKGCPPGGTRSAAHGDSHAQRSEHGVVGMAASAAGQPGREAMRPNRKEDRQRQDRPAG